MSRLMSRVMEGAEVTDGLVYSDKTFDKRKFQGWCQRNGSLEDQTTCNVGNSEIRLQEANSHIEVFENGTGVRSGYISETIGVMDDDSLVIVIGDDDGIRRYEPLEQPDGQAKLDEKIPIIEE